MTRVGLIVPSVNQAMQQEIPAWLGGCEALVGRIPPRGRPGGVLLAEDMPAYGEAALSLARDFGPGLDAIAYGCTAGGFLAGADEEAALVGAMEQETGTRCVSTARAVVDALQDGRCRRIAVVTPYADSMNAALAVYLAAAGIDVVRWQPLTVGAQSDVAAVTDALMSGGSAAMDETCDGLFIACSLLPTRQVIEPLSARLGRPVVSSIGATAVALGALLDRPLVPFPT